MTSLGLGMHTHPWVRKAWASLLPLQPGAANVQSGSRASPHPPRLQGWVVTEEQVEQEAQFAVFGPEMGLRLPRQRQGRRGPSLRAGS